MQKKTKNKKKTPHNWVGQKGEKIEEKEKREKGIRMGPAPLGWGAVKEKRLLYTERPPE